MPSQTVVSDRVANAFERAGITNANDRTYVLQQLVDKGVTSADNQAMVINWAGRLRSALEGGADTYRLLEGLSASGIESYRRLSEENKRIFIQGMVFSIADDLRTAPGTGQDFFRSSVAEHFDSTLANVGVASGVASGIIATISRWFHGTPAPVEAPVEAPAEAEGEAPAVFADMGQEDFTAMVDAMVAGRDIYAVARQALLEEGVSEEEIPMRILGMKMALAASGMQMDFFWELSEDPPATEQALESRVDSFRSNVDGAMATIAESDPAWSQGRDMPAVLHAGFEDLGFLLAALAVPAIMAAVRTSFSSIGERAYKYFYDNAPAPGRRGRGRPAPTPEELEQAKTDYARERTQRFLGELAREGQTGTIEEVFRSVSETRMTAEQFRRDILGITSSSQAVINGELASINERVAFLRGSGASFDITATGATARILPDVPGQPIRNVIARTFRPTATFIVDGWRAWSNAEPKTGFRTFMLAIARTAGSPGYLAYESLRMVGQRGRTFRERATAAGGVAIATWLLLSTFEVTPGPIDMYRGIRGLFSGSPAQQQSGQVSPEAVAAPPADLTPGGARAPAAPPAIAVGGTTGQAGGSGAASPGASGTAPQQAGPTALESLGYDALYNELMRSTSGGIALRIVRRIDAEAGRENREGALRHLLASIRAGGAKDEASLTTLLDQWIAEHPAE